MAKRKKKIRLKGEIVGFQREEDGFIVMVAVSQKDVAIPMMGHAELVIHTD